MRYFMGPKLGVALSLCGALLAGAGVIPAQAQQAVAPVWQSPHQTEHPLVGRVWDQQAQQWITLDGLAYRLSTAKWVLLGEQHDNPDHHSLQAAFLGSMLAAGRRPGIAVEMIGPAQEAALRRVQRQAAQSTTPERWADRLGTAVAWEKRHWPSWSWYKPLFAEALAAGLPIEPANLERDQLKAAGGDSGRVIPAEVEREQTAAVVDGHCGLLPADQALPMVRMQVARDEAMAKALRQADQLSHDGAVLIAGSGHVRRDIAVPLVLGAEGAVISVAMIEAQPGLETAEGYPAGRYDYLVFTPQAEREDPCEALKARFQKAAPAR